MLSHNIILANALVANDFVYKTSLGDKTRKELIELAERLQASIQLAAAYPPYSAAELIMRAIVVLMNAERISSPQEQQYVMTKLRRACGLLGYTLIPRNSKEISLPLLEYFPINGKFPDDPAPNDKRMSLHKMTSKLISLHDALVETQSQQCDSAVCELINAVSLLILYHPDAGETEGIEGALQCGVYKLGYQLDLADWVKP